MGNKSKSPVERIQLIYSPLFIGRLNACVELLGVSGGILTELRYYEMANEDECDRIEGV